MFWVFANNHYAPFSFNYSAFITHWFYRWSYLHPVYLLLEDSVFRLHVLANSDSEEDQQLKLKVRDALLSYMNTLSSNCNTKEEAIQIATQHQNEFQTIAENVIVENGYNYPVQIKINNFYFPTKSYGDISTVTLSPGKMRM